MPVFIAMIMILVILPLAFFFVLLAGKAGTSARGRRTVDRPDEPYPPAPPPLDPAEQELRMRYARGEIDREEFLQRRIDLER
ncbi:SHOCT domain-containing protein [Nocardiopsis alba]|uniref:SHOCT domain-containing protein n=1 Tax=Nocardiopsis alba TaxID=53437 RepID=UPI0005A7AFD3|nr:SHOCT domain-containing protein [Nocardiopsis alba]